MQVLWPISRHLIMWSSMQDSHHRVNLSPLVVESHGSVNRYALQFLSELVRRLVETTGDVQASSFLFQRISVCGATIQFGSAA